MLFLHAKEHIFDLQSMPLHNTETGAGLPRSSAVWRGMGMGRGMTAMENCNIATAAICQDIKAQYSSQTVVNLYSDLAYISCHIDNSITAQCVDVNL